MLDNCETGKVSADACWNQLETVDDCKKNAVQSHDPVRAPPIIDIGFKIWGLAVDVTKDEDDEGPDADNI